MKREKNLVKNTMIITIGKVFTQLITFFLLPLYTAVLSTADYGIVDLLNTLIALLIPIASLQIEQALFRFLIDNRENESEKKNIISTSFFLVVAQVILYLGIFCIIAPFLNNNYKYFLATNVIACMLSNVFLQIARGLGDNKTYSIGCFITALVTIILNVLFLVVFKWGASGMLLANLIGNIACILYVFIVLKLNRYISKEKYDSDMVKRLCKYSMPLIPNSISWWIFNSSDRIIVTSFLGIAQTGILSVSYKFSGIYITIYNIFNMTWTETASLHINDVDRDEFFSNIINKCLALFGSICLGIISIMPFIFPIMINEKFNEAYNQIPILMLASLFNVIVGLISVIYIAKKDTKSVARTSVLAAILNIIINLALVKIIGLYASSISTLVAYSFIAFYRIYDVKKYVKIKLDSKFVLSTVLLTIALFVGYYMNYLYLNIALFLLTIIYCFVINKDSIDLIINILKKKKAGANNE